MAYVVSSIKQTVFGDMKVVFCDVTADSAEGTVIVPGIGKIIFAQYMFASGTASMTCMNVKYNLGTTGTVAAGQLGISGSVANTYRFAVYGTA